MIITGKYNEAKIFTETIEEGAIAQIKLLCDQPMSAGSIIRIMPDVHSGAGCTIGTTMTIIDKIIPNLVGVDIGCGVEVIKLKNKKIELSKLDKLIYAKIPSGFNIRDKVHRLADEINLNELCCRESLNIPRAEKSIGTLGGGNHFIEANIDSTGSIYIVIHSGSRHLGLEVANYYQNEGYKALNGSSKDDVEKLIAEYKENGRQKEIQKALKELNKNIVTDVPKSLAYVEGKLFDNYMHDMRIVQRYAVLNRKAMAMELIKGMKLDVEEEFTTIHNYIDAESMILRKGAVSAKQGEKLLIPINMRDGSLLCIGRGNSDWNYSAPHGAGRLMSRSQAVNSFTLSSFKKEMEGIYTTSVSKDTLDECPSAYKSMEDIVSNIQSTVDIKETLKPIYNFKAGDE